MINDIACEKYQKATTRIEELKTQLKPIDDHLILYKILQDNMNFFKSEMRGKNNYIKYEALENYIRYQGIMSFSEKTYNNPMITRLLFRNGIFKPLTYLFVELTLNFILSSGITWLVNEYLWELNAVLITICMIFLILGIFFSRLFDSINFYIVRKVK